MTTRRTAPRVIHLVAAARPNFMKIAPLYHALAESPDFSPVIVHCGQHYDVNMSEAFFRCLRLPEPGVHLGAGSGTHAEQTARAMVAYEQLLGQAAPDLAVVVGDVNSTMACTLAAVKLGVRLAHLEAGLRSFDRTMPEEINRIVTDSLADLLWTHSPDADENLSREGVPREKIHRVGNIMIDSLEMIRGAAESSGVRERLGLASGGYGLVTLHRPANVDDHQTLERLSLALANLSGRIPLVFPLHPRTRKNLERFGLAHILQDAPGIRLLDPQDYIAFMNLLLGCSLVITDSGGVQEESTYLGIPCLTLRPNTERPVTLTHGTNRLCTVQDLERSAAEALAGQENGPGSRPPELWDGKTAGRVVASMRRFLESSGV